MTFTTNIAFSSHRTSTRANQAPMCPSSPLPTLMRAIMCKGGTLEGRCAYGRPRWHHCSNGDILLFALQDGARGEEESHMVGIYQPMAARVIECELKVKLQTAERVSMAWSLGLVPGCSSSPLKEGQQSNESHSPPNLQLVLRQLYCISLQFWVFT